MERLANKKKEIEVVLNESKKVLKEEEKKTNHIEDNEYRK